jgi:FtsZ-interacting cell division protein ZipA
MHDLQLILIFLGVLIVVGVLLFNWWQEKKFKQKIASQFKQPMRDVLVPDASDVSTQDVPKSSASKAEASYDQQPSAFEGEMHDSSSLNISSNTLKNEKPEPFFELFNNESKDDLPTYDVLKDANSDGLMFETDDTIANDDIEELEAEDSIYQENQPYTAPIHPTANAPISTAASTITEAQNDNALLPENLLSQMDLIAMLYASTPTRTSAVLPFVSQLDEVHPNFMLLGLDLNNHWIDLRGHAGNEVISKIACSQQLADRGGPVSRQVLNRFQHAVETMGLELNCHVEWQSKADPANTATELDQFCMDVDQTIGFHLMGNDNARFHGTKLRGLAESQGFALADDGKFYQAGKVADFYIVNGDGQAFTAESLKNITIGKVSFQLEIPTAKNSVERFDQMIRVARQFATALDASVVDDAMKPLNDIHLEKIRQQLRVIHAKMVARGVVPGSVHALRLFA